MARTKSKPGWRTLKGQQRLLFVPPKIQGMLSGSRYAFQGANGDIGLVYESGNEQTRGAQDYDINDFLDYFNIVTFVQEGIIPHGMPLYN